MKKFLILFFGISTIFSLAVHAEVLYWGNSRQTPLEVAATFLQEKLPHELEERSSLRVEQTQVPCPSTKNHCASRAKITVIQDNLADDSVKSIKHTLLLEREQNQPWKIIEQEELFQCYQGRGHQNFSKKLCS